MRLLSGRLAALVNPSNRAVRLLSGRLAALVNPSNRAVRLLSGRLAALVNPSNRAVRLLSGRLAALVNERNFLRPHQRLLALKPPQQIFLLDEEASGVGWVHDGSKIEPPVQETYRGVFQNRSPIFRRMYPLANDLINN